MSEDSLPPLVDQNLFNQSKIYLYINFDLSLSQLQLVLVFLFVLFISLSYSRCWAGTFCYNITTYHGFPTSTFSVAFAVGHGRPFKRGCSGNINNQINFNCVKTQENLIVFCQAQPQLQLQLWLRLVLFLDTSSYPPIR